MEKDYRFEVVQYYIAQGKIVSFKQVFNYFPRTLLVKELGTNSNRFKRLVNRPDELFYREIRKIAAYFSVEVSAITKLIDAQIELSSPRKKRLIKG